MDFKSKLEEIKQEKSSIYFCIYNYYKFFMGFKKESETFNSLLETKVFDDNTNMFFEQGERIKKLIEELKALSSPEILDNLKHIESDKNTFMETYSESILENDFISKTLSDLIRLEDDYKLVCKYIIEELIANLEIGKRTISIDEVFDIMKGYINKYPKLGKADSNKGKNLVDDADDPIVQAYDEIEDYYGPIPTRSYFKDEEEFDLDSEIGDYDESILPNYSSKGKK